MEKTYGKAHKIALIITLVSWVLFLVLPWLLPMLSMLFGSINSKKFTIDESQYIIADNYQWSTYDDLKYLGYFIEKDEENDTEKQVGVYSLHKKSKDYIGTFKMLGFFGLKKICNFYIKRSAEEPIMVMDVKTNGVVVSVVGYKLHADEESAGKIIKVIRETQPEKYEYDNISKEFFADVMIELDTVSEIKYSCEIICDKDTGVYYLVRYDVIDGCYYKHKI